MGVGSWLKSMTAYDTPKQIRIQSVTCGCLQSFFYATISLAVCCIVIKYRLYQETDEVNSSVRTSVKGVVDASNRIWDTAEYTISMQAMNSFFVMTNVIKTENQLEQECPEQPSPKTICSSDQSCKKGSVDVHSHGILTGRCVRHKTNVKTCEVRAWCPVESTENPPEPAVLRSSENFTVLIKNNIHFPKFNYTVLNIPPILNTSCTYNKKTSPLCPIFRLGDILQEANQNFPEVAVKGGIIAVEINWDCNLDSWFYDCSPKYSFRRLDDKKITPGFHFRYARYYKLPDGKEQRTLFKVYGIRFDVLVFGTGRKFDAIVLIKNVGSMISYFGLVVTAMELAIRVGQCTSYGKSRFYKIYNRRKYEILPFSRQVIYVSFVDKPYITLIQKPLKTSLQYTEGTIVESHPEKFCDVDSCCTSESNEDHDNEQYELGQPLREGSRFPNAQEWCFCGECQPTESYHEQLCCRMKEGQCITTTHSFQQLVLCSDTLKKALLYKYPFLRLTDANINKELRHFAYKQYIQWSFGSFDLEDRAVVPNCCRCKIRDTYPEASNIYIGFHME
ncbi:P2X purinoceptor 7 isoform X2 [Phaenicophaeus curvirostris]|uniref:P2X purinoceptor 7 isoform X2 n=1 Tax=Phaenicophaeus curvirostris TaxID=33595 RepID=UPI0037F0B4CA